MAWGTGYTSIDNYLGANQGTLATERSGLISDVARQGAAAQQADDAIIGQVKPQTDYSSLPGYLDALKGEQDFTANAQNLGSEGGLTTTLQGKYGATDPTYTQDKASFDASLIAGSPDLQQMSAAGQHLSGYLDKGAGAIAAQPLPPTPAPPPASGPVPNPNNAGGVGPEGGDERGKKRTPWPWIYPPDTGIPTRKGPGGK